MLEIRIRPRVLKDRILLTCLGIGGALAMTAGLAMPEAHADPDGLVAWAYGNGYTGNPAIISLRGAAVCADLANGLDGEQAAWDLWLNTGIVALSDARRFVIASVENLCPQFDHRHDAPAASISQTFVA